MTNRLGQYSENCPLCKIYKETTTRPRPGKWDGAFMVGEFDVAVDQKAVEVEKRTGKAKKPPIHAVGLYFSRSLPKPTFFKLLLRLIDEFCPDGTVHVIGMEKPLTDVGKNEVPGDKKDLLADPTRFTHHRYE